MHRLRLTVKTLAELQAECASLGINVPTNGKPKKDDYIAALREHRWRRDHADEPVPDQIMPMLLGNWEDMEPEQAAEIEGDSNGWIMQPKLDGVRALFHIENGKARITSRCVSEVTYRLSEFQDNVPHLNLGLSLLSGTILDGELVCPVPIIDTGSSVSAHPLQATVAILATSPEKAQAIQDRHQAHLRFHAFDILRSVGEDVTARPLHERQELLRLTLDVAGNPYLELVPSGSVGKAAEHGGIVAKGGEGTVWKRLDQPYEPGRRVKHWIKRKRGIEMEAFVTGFQPGTAEKGHAHLVGAVEFSVGTNGTARPIAWVCGWTDADRQAMTHHDADGEVQLNTAFLNRRALITGQELSAKSQRITHPRILRWLDS